MLYLFMTIWQLNETVILKCTVYRAEVSATFSKFSVPGLMPNMAQSKRFRLMQKKSLFKLSEQEQKEDNSNLHSKLTGHLENVILQFIVAVCPFPPPHLSVTALLHLSWESFSVFSLFLFLSFYGCSIFLTCFEHSRARRSL